MTHTTRNALLALGALVGTLACGAAGAAAPAADIPSVAVKFSPRSLETDRGVNELYGRIVRAAKQVCPDAPVRDLALQQQVQACRTQAVARAIRQIDNSRLAALYAGHFKNG
jgi:UrcA family protein